MIPRIWLMSDERIAPDVLLRAANRLPRGAGIVLRHHRSAQTERRRLFGLLAAIARRRGLRLLLAGPATQARAWRADGAHGRLEAGERLRPRRPGFLRTMAAHDARELRLAGRAGADAAFLSPLFATRSHPGAKPLGPVRFAALARRSTVKIIALGGVRPRHARLVGQLGAAAYGAIDGLTGNATVRT